MPRISSFLLPGSYLVTLLLTACSSPTESVTQAAGKTDTATAAIPATKPAALIDQKNGFRAHHFGDALATFPKDLELNPYQSTRFRKVYTRRQENKRIGPTPVFILRYNFYQDKLYGVDLETTLEALPTLVSLYGPATQPDPTQQAYWWQGEVATATLQKTRDAAPWLSIWNNALRAELEGAEKQAQQQNARQAQADL